jgi:hypothetical protein
MGGGLKFKGLFSILRSFSYRAFLKLASVWMRLNLGFLPGEGFSAEHPFCRFLDALAKMRTTLEQPHFTSGVLELRRNKLLCRKSFSSAHMDVHHF